MDNHAALGRPVAAARWNIVSVALLVLVVDLQIVLFNDDYTPMEFVVTVLQEFFSMTREDATETMLEVHRDGKAVTGLYARRTALDAVKQIREHARIHGHPLRCEVAIPKDLIDPPPGSP